MSYSVLSDPRSSTSLSLSLRQFDTLQQLLGRVLAPARLYVGAALLLNGTLWCLLAMDLVEGTVRSLLLADWVAAPLQYSVGFQELFILGLSLALLVPLARLTLGCDAILEAANRRLATFLPTAGSNIEQHQAFVLVLHTSRIGPTVFGFRVRPRAIAAVLILHAIVGLVAVKRYWGT